MNKPDLKPCPFCGYEDAVIYQKENKHRMIASDYWYFVRCADCFAQTSEYTKEQTAVDNWNRRTQKDK